MTTSAEIDTARRGVQLNINNLVGWVERLEFEVDDGATWNEINADWGIGFDKAKGYEEVLVNLQRQNDGMPPTDPDKSATTFRIAENIAEVNALINRLLVIEQQALANSSEVARIDNLPADSAGTIVLNDAAGAKEGARLASPDAGADELVVLTDANGEITATNIISQEAVNTNATNARLATLSGDFSSTLDTVQGGGITSTTGGGNDTVNVVTTQTPAGTIANSGGVSTSDDAYTNSLNSSAGANNVDANGVVGRASIANEFLQTITASPNRLAALASQTYTISIYLMDIEEYDRLMQSDRKVLPSRQLIMQSGGATIGERNKYFDLDFYPENIEFKCMVGTQGVGSPHNAVTLEFDVLEPQGITFLERLRLAVWDHTGNPGATINGQNYLMVVRFYGYDENGNLISGSSSNGTEPTSDPDAIVEKFIPFQIAMLRYKLAAQVVQYQLQCMIPQTTVGFSTARGTIPFNFQLDAPDVGTLFNGNMQFSAATLAARDFTDGNTGTFGEFGNNNSRAGSSSPTITQGLTDALNQNQQTLVKKGAQSIADVYIILLEDVPGFKDAKMKKQGTTNKKTTPMTMSGDPNVNLNVNKQNFDNNGRTYSITAGTQITQLIDQVMKNSDYITTQQNVVFDEVTGKEIAQPPVEVTQWYKITQKSRAIGWDDIRKDYAYEITYKVSRYKINTPKSPYFPPSTYRGSHKIYNYLFTGENTEVLNLEFEANTNYITPIGNSGLVAPVDGDGRFAQKQMFASGAESSQQGGAGESTLPAAQLAGRLYADSDVLKVEIEIVGDPDWITQSEVFYTTDNLGAFEPDGSLNVNSSEVLFEVRFNRSTDYDFATGLTPKYSSNANQGAISNNTNIAEERLVFAAYQITNFFKEGKFTQRIEGTLREFNGELAPLIQGIRVPDTNNKNGFKAYRDVGENTYYGNKVELTDETVDGVSGVPKAGSNTVDDDGGSSYSGPF